MIAPDTFVGSLAIALAIGIAITALTGHSITRRSRLINHLHQRFGEWTARAFLMLVAIVLLIAGWMILKDVRPSYATPAGSSGGLVDQGLLR